MRLPKILVLRHAPAAKQALGTLLKDPVRNVKGAAERVRDRMAAIGIAV